MQTDDDGPITPTSRQGFNHEFDDDHHHLQRRSVLTKVKEKAKRWRQRLSKKKHSRSGGDPTPAWGVSLDDDDDDEWDEKEHRGAPSTVTTNPPYLLSLILAASHLPSPPVYQSEMANDTYRHTTTATPTSPTTPQQETRQSTTTDEQKGAGWNPFDDDDAADNINENAAGDTQPEATPIERSSSISRLAGAVSTVIKAPAYMVSGATQMIVSKIQGSPADEAGAKEACDDNGVSIKDDLKDKLEPGDGEKALSEVITEASSPRMVAQCQSEAENPVEERVLSPSEITAAAAQAARHQVEETSVVEKVRGAVFSLIWRKEQTPVQVDIPPKSSCE